RNINYTNVCNVYCKFCAFYRTEKDEDHYMLSFEQIDQKLDELSSVGGVQILMQGGHHPKLPFEWYLDLLRHIREKYPHINIHGFSPPEFQHFAATFGMPLCEVISEFICWTFQPQPTVLKVKQPTGVGEYLRTQALARIFLNNIENIQSSWLTQGPEIGQIALRYGANDFGSVMMEENVVSSAGTTF